MTFASESPPTTDVLFWPNAGAETQLERKAAEGTGSRVELFERATMSVVERNTRVAVVKAHPNGADIHVDASALAAAGVGPGEQALVEVGIRPYTRDEWIAVGTGRVFTSDEEEDDFFDRCPEPSA